MLSNADDTASPGLLNSLHPSTKTEAKQSRITFHNHTAGSEECTTLITSNHTSEKSACFFTKNSFF